MNTTQGTGLHPHFTFTVVSRGYSPSRREDLSLVPDRWLTPAIESMTEELEQIMGGDIRHPVYWYCEFDGTYHLTAITRDEHLFQEGAKYGGSGWKNPTNRQTRDRELGISKPAHPMF